MLTKPFEKNENRPNILSIEEIKATQGYEGLSEEEAENLQQTLYTLAKLIIKHSKELQQIQNSRKNDLST